MLPAIPATKSDNMSPYRFGASIVLYFAGFTTNFIANASTISESNSFPNFFRVSDATLRNKTSLGFTTFALCVIVIFPFANLAAAFAILSVAFLRLSSG